MPRHVLSWFDGAELVGTASVLKRVSRCTEYYAGGCVHIVVWWAGVSSRPSSPLPAEKVFPTLLPRQTT